MDNRIIIRFYPHVKLLKHLHPLPSSPFITPNDAEIQMGEKVPSNMTFWLLGAVDMSR